MYTIFDYLKYYGNSDIREIPWNIMDNLLCASIVYMPIDGFKKTKTIEEIYQLLSNKKIESKIDYMTAQTKELIYLMHNSKRYKKIRFKNFINILNDNTQFGAITIILDDIKVISYKGTDGSIIGWKENFRLAYTYPTYTQKLAIRYLSDNICILDEDVYVIGHSKGGNLAMVSAMELDKIRFTRIKQVINFDGPGFRKKEFYSKKFEKLSTKLLNVIPNNSFVGVLLYNENYNVVTTNSIGVNIHYLTNWNSYGTVLVDGVMGKMSNMLHESSLEILSKLEFNSFRELTETAFESMGKKNTDRIDLSLKDIIKLIAKAKNLDQETYKHLQEIISSMLKIYNK